MSRRIAQRLVYVRIVVDGKKKLIPVGDLNRSLEFTLYKGAPLPGGFEGLFEIDNNTD